MSAFTFEMFSIELEVGAGPSRTKRFLVHTSNGHYKYYIMDFQNGSGMVKCLYGKIGTSPQGASYSHSDGLKKLREKLNKGYKEITSEEELKKFYLTGK